MFSSTFSFTQPSRRHGLQVLGVAAETQLQSANVTGRCPRPRLRLALTTRITQAYESKDARDGALASGMGQGMEACYQQLDEVLT
jgi:hypothetical protein